MKAIALALCFASMVVPALAQQVITPNEAKDHVGQLVTVEGPVGGVHHAASGKVTFIDMGGRYPNKPFAGVIFSDDASRFPEIDTLDGKTIDVTGRVQLYRGAPEIIINDAKQLNAK
jgi:DNA/RNA endonuclease YhcR with UshA esterase domain